MALHFEQQSQAKGSEYLIVRDATDAARMKHIFYELRTVPEIQIIIPYVF
jgi:hypothetical protein